MEITIDELKKIQCLGRGACANVYKYNSNTAIKVFNEKGKEMHTPDTFNCLIGIQNATCVFPQQEVTIDGEISGYIMELVEGKPIHERIKEIDIQELIEAIKIVEKDLEILSKEKVLFHDFNHRWNALGRK